MVKKSIKLLIPAIAIAGVILNAAPCHGQGLFKEENKGLEFCLDGGAKKLQPGEFLFPKGQIKESDFSDYLKNYTLPLTHSLDINVKDQNPFYYHCLLGDEYLKYSFGEHKLFGKIDAEFFLKTQIQNMDEPATLYLGYGIKF